MAIVVGETQERLGALGSLLIHPDTGSIEGIRFSLGGLSRTEYCISTLDVVHWGLHIDVRSDDAVGPLEENVRFQEILHEGRTVLRQRIRTDGARDLGLCKDIQFDTERFQVEWLFPRTWFRWGRPIPATAILEVRSDAVIVRETAVSEKQPFLQRDVLKADIPVVQPTRALSS